MTHSGDAEADHHIQFFSTWSYYKKNDSKSFFFLKT